MPQLMNELIGTKFKVVTGFQGPTSAQLALERGEVEAIVKPWSSIKVGSADWLREKKIYLIVQYTHERHRELQDVPAIVDLAQDDEQRQIFALFSGGAPLGTALAGAARPVRPATVAALRQAFDATMRDPALLDEVKQAGVDIDPLPGAALQKVVDETFESPQTCWKRRESSAAGAVGWPRRSMFTHVSSRTRRRRDPGPNFPSIPRVGSRLSLRLAGTTAFNPL